MPRPKLIDDIKLIALFRQATEKIKPVLIIIDPLFKLAKVRDRGGLPIKSIQTSLKNRKIRNGGIE